MSLCGGARCSGTWRGIDSINQYYRCIILKVVHPAQAAEWKDNYTSIEREKDEGRRPLNGFYLGFFCFCISWCQSFSLCNFNDMHESSWLQPNKYDNTGQCFDVYATYSQKKNHFDE